MSKKIFAFVAGMLLLIASEAGAQQLPQNFMNMLFFVSGCASYVPPAGPPPQGALCIDTSSGGMYVSNGSAFVIGGSELWTANAGAGQTTATTTFFTANGNSTNNTTENITMELPTGPTPVTIRNLNCQVSAAPGGGNSDTFTVRSGGPGPVAVGSMANTAVLCAISGASAKSCNSGTLSAALAAGSVITISDVTTGTPAARTLTCSLQVDEL